VLEHGFSLTPTYSKQLNWQKLISFFIAITLTLLSESIGKKEVIEKTQKWLNEESVDFTTEENPYLYFRIDTKNPNQTIILHKNKPDSIEFLTIANLEKEDQKAYVASKNKEEKLRIMWDLQRSLLEINVGYKIEKDLENLESIIINKTIYFDGLTKDKFMDARFALLRGFSLVQLMLQQLRGRYYSNSNTKFML
jgi:hypothetical protein